MDIFQFSMSSYQKTKTEASNKITAAEFDEIFDLYYKRVYKYICYRINHQHIAEDLCSQVFEKVISKYSTFSPEKSSFEVWLFAIARNVITDYHRSGKKLFSLSLDSTEDYVSPNPSPEENLITKDKNKELFAALSKLSEKERNILAMKFAAGLKNSEIADLQGISGSHVGVVLYRSLKKLRHFLDVGGFYHE